MDAYEARDLIAGYDPMLAHNATDDQVLAIARGLGDARTSGITAGLFWGVALTLLGYAVYRGLAKGGTVRAILEAGGDTAEAPETTS